MGASTVTSYKPPAILARSTIAAVRQERQVEQAELLAQQQRQAWIEAQRGVRQSATEIFAPARTVLN